LARAPLPARRGERGTDPWLVAVHGPPKLIRGDVGIAGSATATATAAAAPAESAEDRAQREQAAARLKTSFIVVAPQCPLDVWWDDDAVLALLDEVLAKYRADPRRVYLTGLSMGGYGTWSVGLKHPERFAASCRSAAAAARVTSRARPPPGRPPSPAWACACSRREGPGRPAGGIQRMIAALKKEIGIDVELTIYPDATHDSWTRTYANPELYEWLLQHERPADAR